MESPRRLLPILRRCAIRRYLAGEIDVITAQEVIGLTHVLERVCWGESCPKQCLSYEVTNYGRDNQCTE